MTNVSPWVVGTGLAYLVASGLLVGESITLSAHLGAYNAMPPAEFVKTFTGIVLTWTRYVMLPSFLLAILFGVATAIGAGRSYPGWYLAAACAIAFMVITLAGIAPASTVFRAGAPDLSIVPALRARWVFSHQLRTVVAAVGLLSAAYSLYRMKV